MYIINILSRGIQQLFVFRQYSMTYVNMSPAVCRTLLSLGAVRVGSSKGGSPERPSCEIRHSNHILLIMYLRSSQRTCSRGRRGLLHTNERLKRNSRYYMFASHYVSRLAAIEIQRRMLGLMGQ